MLRVVSYILSQSLLWELPEQQARHLHLDLKNEHQEWQIELKQQSLAWSHQKRWGELHFSRRHPQPPQLYINSVSHKLQERLIDPSADILGFPRPLFVAMVAAGIAAGIATKGDVRLSGRTRSARAASLNVVADGIRGSPMVNWPPRQSYAPMFTLNRPA